MKVQVRLFSERRQIFSCLPRLLSPPPRASPLTPTFPLPGVFTASHLSFPVRVLPPTKASHKAKQTKSIPPRLRYHLLSHFQSLLLFSHKGHVLVLKEDMIPKEKPLRITIVVSFLILSRRNTVTCLYIAFFNAAMLRRTPRRRKESDISVRGAQFR